MNKEQEEDGLKIADVEAEEREPRLPKKKKIMEKWNSEQSEHSHWKLKEQESYFRWPR